MQYCWICPGLLHGPVTNVVYIFFTNKILDISFGTHFETTVFFFFSNKMMVFRAGKHRTFFIIANGETPDQIASSEMV